MRRRFTPVLILLAAGIFVSAGTPTRHDGVLAATDPAGLVVHEWGTFTSVAGQDGVPVEWVPQQGPSDLPCFVDRVRLAGKGWLPATVRMETPVLYFYSPEARTVDVRVGFRRGIITEWYPKAVVAPMKIEPGTLANPGLAGTIAWNQVRIVPGAEEDYPVESAPNHYYAARKTDASPIEVGTSREKFLFYRGLGNFALPLGATLAADGAVIVRASGGTGIGDVMLFQNRGGEIGYEIRRGAGERLRLKAKASPDGRAAVRQGLTEMLVAHGLYAKEAAAMVETWRDSWFEEGTRLFYILPRQAIDAVLPLEINPPPAAVARVFVGRIEIIPASVVEEVRTAVTRGESAAIVKYARFFTPIMQRIADSSTPFDRPTLDRVWQLAFTTLSRQPVACQ